MTEEVSDFKFYDDHDKYLESMVVKKQKKARYLKKNLEKDMERFWNLVIPRPEWVYRKMHPLPRQNPIQKLDITIVGKPRKGKTEFLYWLGNNFKERWHYPVHSMVSPDNDPMELLNNLHEYYDTQYIFCEDFTSAMQLLERQGKEGREKAAKVVHEWFQKGHWLKKSINRPFGYIVSALGVHRLGSSVGMAFKTNTDIWIFKNVPGTEKQKGKGDWDYNNIRDLIGMDGVEFLMRNERLYDQTRDPKYLGWFIWRKDARTVGVGYNGLAPRNYKVKTPSSRITYYWDDGTRTNYDLDNSDNSNIEPDKPDIKNIVPDGVTTAENYNLVDMPDMDVPDYFVDNFLDIARSEEPIYNKTVELTDPKRSVNILEVFNDYLQGIPQRDLSENYEIAKSTISDNIGNYAEDGLGYDGEKVVLSWLQQFDGNWQSDGGNQHGADLVNHKTREIISLKTKKDFTYTPGSDGDPLAKKEVEFLNAGYNVELWVWRIRKSYRDKFGVIKRYKVVQKSVRVVDTSTFIKPTTPTPSRSDDVPSIVGVDSSGSFGNGSENDSENDSENNPDHTGVRWPGVGERKVIENWRLLGVDEFLPCKSSKSLSDKSQKTGQKTRRLSYSERMEQRWEQEEINGFDEMVQRNRKYNISFDIVRMFVWAYTEPISVEILDTQRK